MLDLCLLSNLRSFQPFLQIFFLPHSLLVGLSCLYDCILDGVPQICETLFIFLHSFFLLFFHEVDNFNWPIFKFMDSFFHLLKSLVPLQWIFCFSYLLYFSAPEFLLVSFPYLYLSLIFSIWGDIFLLFSPTTFHPHGSL